MKRVKGYISTRPLGSYDFEFFVEDSMTDQEIKNKVEDMLELSMHYDVEAHDRGNYKMELVLSI